MQQLSTCREGDGVRPRECRSCGLVKFHSHGSYERDAIWELGGEIVRVTVMRYLCVRCYKTVSVLTWGLMAYRLLSIFVLSKGLYDEEEERNLDLRQSYRRRWEKWYGTLRRGIGNLFWKLPQGAREGWGRLGFAERNPELVSQSGWSLFGRYRIHAPQTVF